MKNALDLTTEQYDLVRRNMTLCECDGFAFGVTLLPWDSSIKLNNSDGLNSRFPRFLGVIHLSKCAVPILDMRDHAETKPSLIVVTSTNRQNELSTIALVVNLFKGSPSLPANLTQNVDFRKN